jgi:hypothetical protein
MAWGAFVVIAVGLVVLVAHPWNHGTTAYRGTLTYRIEPSKGYVKLVLTDDRSGKHTTWITLGNAEGKLVPFGIAACCDGSSDGSETSSSLASEPAGIYSYAVYDIAGIHYSMIDNGSAKDRIANGTVKVP